MSGQMPTMQQMSATQLGPLPPGPGASPSVMGGPSNMPMPRPPMMPPQLGGMGAPPGGPMPQQPPMPQQLPAGARPLQSIAPQLMGGVGSPPGQPGGPRSVPMNLSMMARGGNPLRPGDLKATNPSSQLKLTPAELARLGRFGDTFIAHLTPGEIAVPPQVQTPQLMQMLQQAFQAAHVDVNQFTVGSKRSSINPQTGMPEYNFLSALAGPLLSLGGATLGNLAFPGIGGIIGGALGGGAGGALSGGGLPAALLGGALGGLGGWAGSGDLIPGAVNGIGSMLGSDAASGLGNVVPGATTSNLDNLATMGGDNPGAGSLAGAMGAQGGVGPTGPLGASGGPAASTMSAGATSPGTSENPASPLSAVSNSPVAVAANSGTFNAPNNMAGLPGTPGAGSGSSGGFGNWLSQNKSWLPLAVGGGGALLAMMMANQSQTAVPPPAPGGPMAPLNPNYNALLGNNTPLTTPQFVGYNPVQAVTGRNTGYNFYTPGGH